MRSVNQKKKHGFRRAQNALSIIKSSNFTTRPKLITELSINFLFFSLLLNHHLQHSTTINSARSPSTKIIQTPLTSTRTC